MMWRPDRVASSWLIGAGIVLSTGFIFVLDMTPVRGAADGAAYALVIALVASYRRKAVLFCAALSVFLTILGPLIGAEDGETLLQMITGRVFGLAVIGLLTVVLLRLMSQKAATTAMARELADQEVAMRKITRLALAANKSLSERLMILTEWTANAIGCTRVVVGRANKSGTEFSMLDAYDARTMIHAGGHQPPPCWRDEYRVLLDNDLVVATSNVFQSPLHASGREFYRHHGTTAVLHVAAAYRNEVLASLIVSRAEPHQWTANEITFLKSVVQVVGLVFALDSSERTLERLDQVSQGIFVLNKAGAIEYANAAARALMPAAEAGAPALPFAIAPLAGERDDHELILRGREYELHRARLPGGEVLVRVEDVTARNAALAEAGRLEDQMKESAKLQAMGQMAAGIAHDFNNILAAICGLAQNQERIHQKKAAGDLERNLTDRILGVCKRGKSLTEEILGFARTASVERAQLDLTEVLSGSLDVVPNEGSAPATLSLHLPQEALPVEGNAAQLLQLVQNLAVNAMQACDGRDGQIEISAGLAETGQIAALKNLQPYERTLGLIDPARRYCYIRVADNGPGIPPDVIDRIFEPFFTTKGRHKGSGLGLVVVHGVVDSHQGCCHLRSRPGEGAIFTIYLPLLQQAAVVAA